MPVVEKPPHCGWGWVVVLSTFLLHVIIEAVKSFGVFFDEFREDFQESAGSTSVVTSVWMGTLLMCSPVASALSSITSCRAVVITGGVISAIGLSVSFFAQSMVHLTFTVGLVAGFGMSLMYSPSLAMVGKYFDKRHATANGLATSGTGVSLFVLPLLFQFLIDEYDWSGALLIFGSVALNGCVCGALLRPVHLKDTSKEGKHENEEDEVRKASNDGEPENGVDVEPDFPENGEGAEPDFPENGVGAEPDFPENGKGAEQENRENEERGNGDDANTDAKTCSAFCRKVLDTFDLTLLKSRSFIIYSLSLFGLMLGNSMIFVHLVPHAQDLGVEKTQAAFLFSVYGIVEAVSRPISGLLSDRLQIRKLYYYMVGCIGLGICNIAIPQAETYPTLVVCMVFYGISSATFYPLIAVMIRKYSGISRISGGLGWAFVFQGAAFLLGQPIAGWLYATTGNYGMSFYAAATFIFVSVVLLLLVPKKGQRILHVPKKRKSRALDSGKPGADVPYDVDECDGVVFLQERKLPPDVVGGNGENNTAFVDNM